MTDTISPKDYVDALFAKCRPVNTPCGEGTMAWQVWGKPTDKTPLILVHGGFGSWTHWIANVERLSADRLVVTCDIPGLGDSAEATPPITPVALAKPVFEGLDAVVGAGARFDIAAFSFGSVVSAEVCKMAGERARHFVLVGGSGFKGLHTSVTGTVIPDPDDSVEAQNEIHKKNLGILMLWAEDSIDDLAIYTHRENISRARVRSRGMSLSNNVVEAFPDIKARLGGIWGAHDATGSGPEKILARRDLMRAVQPGAPFFVIENAGHWVMYEAPEAFEAALRSILD